MPDQRGRKRIEDERGVLARRYTLGELTEGEFIYEGQRLKARLDALLVAPTASQMPSDKAIGYLSDLAASWPKASAEARADLLHAIIGRVLVRGAEFVGVELTASAEAHGLALCLPENVNVRSENIRSDAALACPRGLEPPTFRSAT